MHYEAAGQGFPLILLHGNGEDNAYFRHQLPVFADKYRVIAIDTRGHGKSPRGDAPFTVDQFADDLYAFMRKHQIAKAHLLGFSDGGNIALTFALKHPEMVEKLILNGANLFPAGMKAWVHLGVCAEYALAWMRRNRRKMELMNLMLLYPQIQPASLEKIRCPVLVIAGTNDMIRDTHTKLIAQSLPNGRLALIDGDHFIAFKEPQAFNQTVLSFLEKRAARMAVSG